jgi:hypothetical protein
LEVLDLEVCDFIQYKPANIGKGGQEEFVVSEIPRDREWFARILPVARAFWDRVLEKRKNGLCEIVEDDVEEEASAVCEIIED